MCVEFEYLVPKHFYAAHYAVYEGAKRAQSSVTINGVYLTLDSFRNSPDRRLLFALLTLSVLRTLFLSCP